MTPITIRGNATRDPELKFASNGNAYAIFDVAATRRKLVNGQWIDDGVDFFRVSVWNRGKAKLAENTAESVKRGKAVIVTGVLSSRTWETDAGEKRTAWEVKADDVALSLQWDVADTGMQSRFDARPPATPHDDPWATPARTDDTPPF